MNRKIWVFKIIAFELVAENYWYYGPNIWHRH